jgi:outer membrane murein-binding lipoprotein Lpp
MLITVLIILAVVVAGVLVATKFGFVKDEDKNGIPDAVEEKVAEVKEKVEEVKVEVAKRAKRVKEEAKDVVKAAKKVTEQAKQVAKAANGAPRKGRKPNK